MRKKVERSQEKTRKVAKKPIKDVKKPIKDKKSTTFDGVFERYPLHSLGQAACLIDFLVTAKNQKTGGPPSLKPLDLIWDKPLGAGSRI